MQSNKMHRTDEGGTNKHQNLLLT